MACHNCNHTMQAVLTFSDGTAWWCPRCGSVKYHNQTAGVPIQELTPTLVERCRAFEGRLRREPVADSVRTVATIFDGLKQTWHVLGLAEAINLPENRPS